MKHGNHVDAGMYKYGIDEILPFFTGNSLEYQE